MFLNAYVCDIDNKAPDEQGRHRENKGKWLHFPITDVDFYAGLAAAGIEDFEFRFSDYESGIDGLREHLTEFEDIPSLNRLAEAIGAFTYQEQLKYEAILQAKKIRGIDGLIIYAEAVNAYNLYPGIKTAEDLAKFCVNEKRSCPAPEDVKPYAFLHQHE